MSSVGGLSGSGTGGSQNRSSDSRSSDSTIKHGNLIDAPTAKLMAEQGGYLVPTVVTYEKLYEGGERIGLSEANVEKPGTEVGTATSAIVTDGRLDKLIRAG